MKNNNPIISIVVPVYNTEKYLRQCIDSLINQTFSNIEIICVNDESQDNSKDIIEEYANKDNRIILLDQKNTGVSGARNTGINKSNGEYIMFVDSDDWIELDTCQIAYEVIIKYKTDVVMWSYIKEYGDISIPKIIYDEELIVFSKKEVKTKLYRHFFGPIDEELAKPENMEVLNPTWMKLYKTSLIKDNGIEFYDIKKLGTGEDGLFNLYLFKYIETAIFIKKNFYHYRKTNDISITTAYNDKIINQQHHLFEIMEKYIQSENLDHTYILALNNRMALSIIGVGLNILSSNESVYKKLQELNRTLSIFKYKNAVKQLSIKHMPIHWKAFFVFAKINFAMGIYLLFVIMNKLRRKS